MLVMVSPWVSLVSMRKNGEKNREGVRRLYGVTLMFLFHIICGLPWFLVLAKVPLADEHRKEGDRSDVDGNPGDLNASVQANWEGEGENSQYPRISQEMGKTRTYSRFWSRKRPPVLSSKGYRTAWCSHIGRLLGVALLDRTWPKRCLLSGTGALAQSLLGWNASQVLTNNPKDKEEWDQFGSEQDDHRVQCKTAVDGLWISPTQTSQW